MNLQNKCPICKSSLIKVFFQDDVIGNGHYPFQKITKNFFTPVIHTNPSIKKFLDRSYFLDVRECLECNHLFQHNIFNPDEELDFHQSYFKFSKINNGFIINDFNINKEITSELDFLCSSFNFKNILDVGASTGEFCILAKKYNITTSSIDICLKTNDLLKEKNIECFNSISEINKTYNIIRVSHVLSHIHNGVEGFIESLISKLDVNGIIYFIDHLNNNNENTKPILSPLLHVNLFSDKSFRILINKFSELKLISTEINVYNKSNLFKMYRRI